MDPVHLRCKRNLDAFIKEKSIKLATIRKSLKEANFVKKERKLAKTLAIYMVAKEIPLQENLCNAILKNQNDLSLTEKDKIWLSDFQLGNPDCLKKFIRNHFNSINTEKNKKKRT